MTWSLTLAGLSRARANSKPHDNKQKYKKSRTIRKQVLTGKYFEHLGQKNEQKHYSRPFKKTQLDTKTLTPSTEYCPCKR